MNWIWDDHFLAWVKMGDGEDRRSVLVTFETPVRCPHELLNLRLVAVRFREPVGSGSDDLRITSSWSLTF